MGKVLAIDYGAVRCGLAITDSSKIIASPLCTVATKDILQELASISQREGIERFVVGIARKLDGSDSATTLLIEDFIQSLQVKFSQIPISRVNEMFTSRMASQALIDGGMKKMDRQKKGNIDMVSAAIILQTYLTYGESI